MNRKTPEEMAYLTNPRPDLTEDTDLWARLLLKAYPVDGEDPDGLFGVLHGLRCAGAHLRMGNGTAVLSHGEISGADYAAWRQQYLVPHGREVSQLLAELAIGQPVTV